MIKNIILTSAGDDKNLKGILTLENTEKSTIVTLKKYNFDDIKDKLILGIKTNGEFYKVEITNEENYLINKKLNLNEKICAVVLSSSGFTTKILIWGSNETSRVWKESILYDIDAKNEQAKEDKKEVLSSKINDYKDENIESLEKTYTNNISTDDYETDEEIETIVDNAFNNEMFDENLEEINETNNKKDFLSTIENQVEELLNNYEEEKALENLIPNSKFVKVNSNDENFYIFGVIKEDNQIKYIVYGLPGEYNVKPNDEYKNYYQWLPLNPENPEGYGYYLMYQDAESGNQIEVMFD